MTYDVVRRMTARICHAHGYRLRRRNHWHRVTDAWGVAIHLQPSIYGPQYYLNSGVWLRSKADVEYLQAWRCPISCRVEELFRDDEQFALSRLLDPASSIGEPEREHGLRDALSVRLVPVLDELLTGHARSDPALRYLELASDSAGLRDLLSGQRS